mmetsp:Transcript_17173/g.58713  ORF Transcript_17173/g.58713 Transcript_17173/m.58713 type:complete len:249 (+) Transcript_17173:1075-1821(+)
MVRADRVVSRRIRPQGSLRAQGERHGVHWRRLRDPHGAQEGRRQGPQRVRPRDPGGAHGRRAAELLQERVPEHRRAQLRHGRARGVRGRAGRGGRLQGEAVHRLPAADYGTLLHAQARFDVRRAERRGGRLLARRADCAAGQARAARGEPRRARRRGGLRAAVHGRRRGQARHRLGRVGREGVRRQQGHVRLRCDQRGEPRRRGARVGGGVGAVPEVPQRVEVAQEQAQARHGVHGQVLQAQQGEARA